MRLRILFFFIIFCGCGLLCAIFLPAAAQDLQLAQTSSRHVTIAYRLTDLQLPKMKLNAEIAIRPDFENAVALTDTGAPELPTRIFVLGVPPGAQVEVSVVPGGIEELAGIFVPPVPVKEPADDLHRLRYTPNPQIYGRDDYYPPELFRVDPPGQFRQQTVVRVQVMPVQYNPVKRQLRVYKDLQIVVRFVGGSLSAVSALSPALATPPREAEEEFYRELILNYEQAKAFRQPRPQRLSRSAGPRIEGPLYKLALREEEEGIYKIDGQMLSRNGINLAEVQPAAIRLFNNGGRELPRDMRRPRPQGLVENAIYVSDGGDGRFDASDFILFYGRGVKGFAFDSASGEASHYSNHFGFDNYYWLNFGGSAGGKRMAERTPQSTLGLTPITSFRDYLFVEEERNPLFESDQTWFGWLFTNRGNDTRTYRVKLTDPVAEGTLSMRFAFYASFIGGFAFHQLAVNFARQDLVEWQIPGSSRLQFYSLNKIGGLVGGDNELLLTYRGSGDAAQMYIDYFEMSYDRQMRMTDGVLIFNGRVGAGPFAYTVSNADANALWLFDVTDFSNATRLPSQNWQVNGSQVTFADDGSIGKIPRRYVAVTPAAFKTVANLTRDEVSNWRSPDHAADMVIITHSDFLSINPVTRQDEGPLARFASLRENYKVDDRLEVEVVNIQDVFDEFSGGMYDPVAIRDFLKYAYENWQWPPLFVLLVGDGDYDPKNIIAKADKNWIPTYHTTELDDIINRVTDSWFTYVAGNDAIMDMAIGRIPARSQADVEAYIDKIIKYETQPIFGPWRNTAVMVADDEFGQGGVAANFEAVHIQDTETLITRYTPRYFDVKKIYLTEFAAVQSASISGVRKPTATDAFMRLVNNGTLLVNYAGHGNSEVWSHERLLNLPTDFNRIQNGDRQALWVAATCTFGKYDIPDKQSFSEELIFAPGHGAIAVLATARDVYASANAALNQQYYRFLFESNRQISARLGTAVILARIQTNFTVNDEKFHVLGDPSLRIAIPRYHANIVSVTPDTIKALAVMTVRGKVERDGAGWPEFNGTVRLEALDSRRDVTYQSPGGFSISYPIPGNSLFRGEAPVQDGVFNVQFFVPKDITYGGQFGRINLYFWDAANDGNGFRDNLPVGGTVSSFVDRAGPNIDLSFVGFEDFRSGDVVGKNPVLRAVIEDSLSGVNITGEIGHKITLALDGQNDGKIDITDLFSYIAGSYTRGTLIYPLGELSEGRHTVEIKAWDNLNNSGTAAVEFVVRPQDRLTLYEVMNYPNPFRNKTAFTFELNLEAEVQVKIYTLSGRLIQILELPQARSGFNVLKWDGRDRDGDELANGVYLYKVIATQLQNGELLRTEEIGKLVVQR
jgi:hypothetical protein